MKLRRFLRQAPLRIVTGAFILNAGLTKRRATDEQASRLHGFASSTYPTFKQMTPEQFVRLLSTGEIALGTALLLPIVPPALVGAGLAGFSAGLIGLYLKTPGMHMEGSLRPTEQGIPLAKDSWLLGIGLALVLDQMSSRRKKATQ
jgi:hypothetical protein